MSAEFKKYCCQNKLTAGQGEGARPERVNPAQPNKAITNEILQLKTKNVNYLNIEKYVRCIS